MLSAGCATGTGASSAAICSQLVYVEPEDEEIDHLSDRTAADILQNNLIIAALCGSTDE
jgi:hypothetical protein